MLDTQWNFATCFESIADAVPDADALVHGEERRTWAALDERAARMAGGLRELGLGPNSKVAAYLYNGNEYLETVYAAFKLRAVPVNVNYRYRADELAYLVDNSDAEVLLFHGALADEVARARDDLPRLRALIQVDDASPALDGAIPYEELVAASDPEPRAARSGDDLFFLYTGGTTGMPKGVMWRAEDLYLALAPALYAIAGETIPEEPGASGAAARRIAAAGRTPTHLPASPLMHGTGLFSTFQVMLLGGSVVTLEHRNFDADELWRAVERERVTQIAIVGDAFAKPMVRALEDAETRGTPYDLSSLQLVISSGVMWTAPVKKALMARGSFICFDSLGSSEGVGFGSSISAPGTDATTARFTIGEHAKVITEDGAEVAPGSGEIGLLALGGPIPVGYYKDPDKTAATFREVGGRRFSIPGDWASVAADGSIELLGRGSVSINSGGEKVFPEEVEEAVKVHPSVADVVVVGVPDERFGEAVTAVVALQDGSDTTVREIGAAVTERLARYKQPRHVVLVDEVRRGPNGKADYAWAKELAAKRVAG